MFQTAVPVVCVRSSTAAEAFYCGALGFTRVAAHRPDAAKDDPRYMSFARGGARLHVHSFPGVPGAGALYVFVDDVDALHAELLANGVVLPHPPIDQEWGTREIAVRDPDGNVVTFGQRRDPAA